MKRPPDEQLKRYDAFAAMAMICDNLGETGDRRDLYGVLDAMVADLQATMPAFACQAGCNQCCYTPPMVTSLEWRALYRQLLALPHDKQLRIIDAAERLRPMAPALQAKLKATLGLTNEAPQPIGLQCPLLIEGVCSAYGGRPLICRGFGYTVVTAPSGPHFFGSALAGAHMAANFPPNVVLPLLDPYKEKIGYLNADGGVQGYLPQWLWAHIRRRAFVPEAIAKPDFLN